MNCFKAVFLSTISSVVVLGCGPAPETLSYCADENEVEQQVDCLEESFEFYGRLVDSSNAFVVEHLQAKIDEAKNNGQRKKHERALEAHLAEYDFAMTELDAIEVKYGAIITVDSTVTMNRTAILEVEDTASNLIHTFDVVCNKALR